MKDVTKKGLLLLGVLALLAVLIAPIVYYQQEIQFLLDYISPIYFTISGICLSLVTVGCFLFIYKPPQNVQLSIGVLLLLSIIIVPAIYYNDILFSSTNYNEGNLFLAAIFVTLAAIGCYILVYRPSKDILLSISVLFLLSLIIVPLVYYRAEFLSAIEYANLNVIVAGAFILLAAIGCYFGVYRPSRDIMLSIGVLLLLTIIIIPLVYYRNDIFSAIGYNNQNLLLAGAFVLFSGIACYLFIYRPSEKIWLSIVVLLLLAMLFVPGFYFKNWLTILIDNRNTFSFLVAGMYLLFTGICCYLLVYRPSRNIGLSLFVLFLLFVVVLPIVYNKERIFFIADYYNNLKKGDKPVYAINLREKQSPNTEKPLIVSTLSDKNVLKKDSNIANINQDSLNKLAKTEKPKDKPKDSTQNSNQQATTDNFVTDLPSNSIIEDIAPSPPADKFADVKSISTDKNVEGKVVNLNNNSALMIFPTTAGSWKTLFMIYPVKYTGARQARTLFKRDYEGVTYPVYKGGQINVDGSNLDVTLVKISGTLPKAEKPYYLYLHDNYKFLIFGDYSDKDKWYIYENNQVRPYTKPIDLNF